MRTGETRGIVQRGEWHEMQGESLQHFWQRQQSSNSKSRVLHFNNDHDLDSLLKLFKDKKLQVWTLRILSDDWIVDGWIVD